MLSKIKARWEAYKKKETVWGHISNIIFILFVAAMIFPTSRKLVSSTLIKLTMFDRGSISQPENPVKLSATDKGFDVFTQNEAIPFQAFDNKVIVINYWATWCPPCIAEMPNFQRVYNDYKNEVVFLFLTNDTKDLTDKFLLKHDYNLPVYNYNKLPAPLNHNSIPTSFVINRNSEIVFSHTGAYKWDSESFREFLDELIAE
jgi:thiol-disulfide isomerase/thioredoxin